MTTDVWKTIPWELETEEKIRLYHKQKVPYVANANALQNIDIWIPSSDSSTPDPAFIPSSGGLWVIYIHGGAWRDPLVLSPSFTPTVKALCNTHASNLTSIAGLASINYSLSSYPNHPTHPAPPTDPSKPLDPSRAALHPDHIVDVLTGLSFLQKLAGFGSNYVLLGHSCGATLALQVAMDHQKWGPRATALQVTKPRVIVGLNGLYDMPKLINDPGEKHKKLQAAYKGFTRLAFGDDERVWHTMCPISVGDWSKEWEEGKKLVLAQSKDDSLVPYWQTVEMKANVEASKNGELHVSEVDAGGDHNELWEKGDRLAEIIIDIVQSLN